MEIPRRKVSNMFPKVTVFVAYALMKDLLRKRTSAFGNQFRGCGILRGHTVARKQTRTLGLISPLIVSGDGKRANKNAKQCVRGEVSTRVLRSHHFCCVGRPT